MFQGDFFLQLRIIWELAGPLRQVGHGVRRNSSGLLDLEAEVGQEGPTRDWGGNRPGGLPRQHHIPHSQLVASRTASEMCVLLGHVVVAPRGPPACGCVHSGKFVGKQSAIWE